MSTAAEADLGQGFVAIDPSFFAPGFTDRMSDLMSHCRQMEPVSTKKLLIFTLLILEQHELLLFLGG